MLTVTFLLHLKQMIIAYLLAFPIGWDRERESRGAGLRTFPLVCLASCGVVILGRDALGVDDQGRVLQGLLTGIGFIGGGAILKGDHSVHGTATAASIWNVCVIGAAVGFEAYDIAALLAVVNFLTLRLMVPLKMEMTQKDPPKQKISAAKKSNAQE